MLEMEAGPVPVGDLRARRPAPPPERRGRRVSSERTGFGVGILHYASDTPYWRRQSLLSKSLGSFGIDSTYACAIAITRQILAARDRAALESYGRSAAFHGTAPVIQWLIAPC